MTGWHNANDYFLHRFFGAFMRAEVGRRSRLSIHGSQTGGLVRLWVGPQTAD